MKLLYIGTNNALRVPEVASTTKESRLVRCRGRNQVLRGRADTVRSLSRPKVRMKIFAVGEVERKYGRYCLKGREMKERRNQNPEEKQAEFAIFSETRVRQKYVAGGD
jgi:hypothetical protein